MDYCSADSLVDSNSHGSTQRKTIVETISGVLACLLACVAIIYFGSKYVQRLAKMPVRKKPKQDFQDFIGTIVLATIWFSVGGLKKRSFLNFNSGSFLVYLLRVIPDIISTIIKSYD